MMKKIMKYIITSSVFIIGSFGVNGIQANAGMRSRISGFFRNLNLLSNVRRERINENIKVEVPRKLVPQANYLHRRDLRLGVGIDDFDETQIRSFHNHHWYLQRRTENGEKITTVSISRPKIKDISGSLVKETYIDRGGSKNNISHHGLPNWHKGSDIKNRLQNNPFLNQKGSTIRTQQQTTTTTTAGQAGNNTLSTGISNQGFDGIDE